MFLKLEDVPDGGRDVDLRFMLPDLTSEDGHALVEGNVRLSGRVTPGPGGVELRARITARLRHTCSRCLETYESTLDAPVRLTLVGDAVEFGEREAEMSPEDAEVFYAEGGRVDFPRIAYEQIVLEAPLKPVCDAACLGLCPSCGVNRNRIECDCRRTDLDPRLVPLLQFKKGKTGDS
jgi:uncharacterized protein